MHRVYAYLIKQRFIAPEVITHFAKQHTLYEDKEHHNAVFVGLKEDGEPKQAHKRSTNSVGGNVSYHLSAVLIHVTALHISERMNDFMSLKLLLIC